MIILGKNSDDKGSQLEALTLQLLKAMGYVNCKANVATGGGTEIDVVGEFILPSPDSPQIHKLICECKAYKNAVSMPHWQQFLGKVLTESIIAKNSVTGCFIALNGVNGNVKGHFDSLKREYERISILDGDKLNQRLTEIYGVADFDSIAKLSSRYTNRVIKNAESVYYDNTFYWLLIFSDGTGTLLDKSGKIIDVKLAAELLLMLANEIELGGYVDLQQESQAIIREKKLQAICLSQLMIGNGMVEDFSAAFDAQPEELRDSGAKLADEGIIQRIGDGTRYEIPIQRQNDDEHVSIELYARMIRHGCLVEAIGCPFYDRYVNSALVKQVCEIQVALPLENQDIDRVIQLLRLSPTAIVNCSEPIAMIANHRDKFKSNADVNQADRDYLFRLLYDSLYVDFRSRELGEHYHQVRKLVEVERNTELKIKSIEKVELQDKMSERIGVAEYDKGGFIHILMNPNTPEPWVFRKKVDPPAESSDSSGK